MSELMIVAAAVEHVFIWWRGISRNGSLTHGHQTSTSEAGDSAHAVKQHNVPRKGTAQTTGPKRRTRDKEADTTAKDVRDAAVKRLKGGAGDKVGRGEPGGDVGGAEVGTDDGVRRRRDGAVEARQEDVGHDGNLDPYEAFGR